MTKQEEYLKAVEEYKLAKISFYDARDVMMEKEKAYFKALQALHPNDDINQAFAKTVLRDEGDQEL